MRYKIDQLVWICPGPIQGKIIDIYGPAPGWGIEHYIIEIETAVDAYLEIRTPGAVWKEKPKFG